MTLHDLRKRLVAAGVGSAVLVFGSVDLGYAQDASASKPDKADVAKTKPAKAVKATKPAKETKAVQAAKTPAPDAKDAAAKPAPVKSLLKAASEIIAGKSKVAPTVAQSSTAARRQSACRSSNGLGVHRTVVIDGAKGQQFGSVQFKDDFLRDKEVVLTFDDGPLAKYTRAILRALDRHCTKATFFAVGRMAMAFPNVLREVADAGHTVAGHTWSHPKLSRLSQARAKRDLEQGFSAVRSAIGRPIAPFFRFPYLDSPKWVQAYMKERKVAVFSIDVDSGDTRGYSVNRIVRKTMSNLKRRKKGILLFHDIKSRTAAAIPTILKKLHENGYKVVHVVGKTPLVTEKKYDELFQKKILAKTRKRSPGTSEPKPAKVRKKKRSWPNDADDPFDSAKAKSRARKRRAALLRARERRRRAEQRRRQRAAKKAAPRKQPAVFNFDSVFGQ